MKLASIDALAQIITMSSISVRSEMMAGYFRAGQVQKISGAQYWFVIHITHAWVL